MDWFWSLYDLAQKEIVKALLIFVFLVLRVLRNWFPISSERASQSTWTFCPRRPHHLTKFPYFCDTILFPLPIASSLTFSVLFAIIDPGERQPEGLCACSYLQSPGWECETGRFGIRTPEIRSHRIDCPGRVGKGGVIVRNVRFPLSITFDTSSR